MISRYSFIVYIIMLPSKDGSVAVVLQICKV